MIDHAAGIMKELDIINRQRELIDRLVAERDAAETRASRALAERAITQKGYETLLAQCAALLQAIERMRQAALQSDWADFDAAIDRALAPERAAECTCNPGSIIDQWCPIHTI